MVGILVFAATAVLLVLLVIERTPTAPVPFPINNAPEVKEVAPVPPLATDNVPLVILATSKLGTSAATKARKVGAPSAADGAANTQFLVLLALMDKSFV